MLCGCGNSVVEENTDIETDSEMNLQTTADGQSNEEPDLYIHINILEPRMNEDNTYEYGLIGGTEYTISDNSLDFALEYVLENDYLDNKVSVPYLIAAFIDDIPIKFRLDSEEYVLTSEVSLLNNETSYIHISLCPESLEIVNKKGKLVIACIPMMNNTVWDNESIMMAGLGNSCSKKISNEFSTVDDGNNQISEMTHMKSVKEIVGQELWEITKHTGQIRDFVLKGMAGNYYYIGDYQENMQLTTYFLLDGKFIESEEGCLSLRWNGYNGYSAHEIELPEMTPGRHIVSAITVVRNDNSIDVFRSEGTIIE